MRPLFWKQKFGRSCPTSGSPQMWTVQVQGRQCPKSGQFKYSIITSHWHSFARSLECIDNADWSYLTRCLSVSACVPAIAHLPPQRSLDICASPKLKPTNHRLNLPNISRWVRAIRFRPTPTRCSSTRILKPSPRQPCRRFPPGENTTTSWSSSYWWSILCLPSPRFLMCSCFLLPVLLRATIGTYWW